MAYGSKITQLAYYFLPGLFKNIISSVYGWEQRRIRYGECYNTNLKFLRESQYWPNEQLREYQIAQRDHFLRSVLSRSGYYKAKDIYRRYFNDGAFENLPIISKNEVRCHIKEFIIDDLHKIRHKWVHTSGTTGTALIFPVTMSAFEKEYSYRALHNSWGGVNLAGRDKIAFCAGHPVAFIDRKRPPFWVYDWANNMLFFSSYHLTAQNMPAYIKELENFNPFMLAGYPSSVYLIAIAYERYGKGNLKIRSLFTSSETLLDFQRKKIEAVFCAKVYNYYGNAEGCANAMECEDGEIHLKMEHSFVEMLDDKDQPCKPGDSGRMICTGFGNEAFPLIRYDIGDVVSVSGNQHSKCGRGGIILDQILGRNDDYVITPDGRLIGRLSQIFKDSTNVIEAQIVQHTIDEVIIKIVRSSGYKTKDENDILEKTRLRLGSSIRLNFEYVEQIPRMKNGKYRFIWSDLNQAEILKSLTSKA